MTIDADIDARWYHSLRFRLIVLMSVALLPIGLIALWQTRSVTEKADENGQLALMVMTESAALDQRLVLQRAFGAAQGLSALLPQLLSDPALCNATMADFVDRSRSFTFAGYLPASGVMTCSSEGKLLDFSTFADFDDAVAAAEPYVSVSSASEGLPGQTVLTVSQPVITATGEMMGFVRVSIPHTALVSSDLDDPAISLIDLMTFNRNGEILTTSRGQENAEFRLPQSVTLASLVGQPAHTFSARDRTGLMRGFAVVPIDQDAVYVLGIWDADRGVAAPFDWVLPTSLFPAIMWIASLLVALLAVHRLVTRHVDRLGVQMADFARSRKMPDVSDGLGIPTEIQRIRTAFLSMTDSILRDEAKLEDAVRARNALIKEVHHRVKNNLQLISSIINMQIRDVDNPETATVLRRIQDRVLSLATIHRDLYQTATGGQVDVGHLVHEIVDHSIAIGTSDHQNVRLETDIDPIRLFPDQAVPMSLLAAEAATNSMKYFGAKDGEQPWISVRFKAGEGRRCQFVFANSVGQKPDLNGTGLGARLMNAFAMQLGADIDIEETNDSYKMSVSFDIADFTAEIPDY